jgi:hypothetical protein
LPAVVLGEAKYINAGLSGALRAFVKPRRVDKQ